MAGGVGQIELLGCGGITADIEKDTADAIGCLNDGLVDGARLGRMLVGHFKSIVPERGGRRFDIDAGGSRS